MTDKKMLCTSCKKEVIPAFKIGVCEYMPNGLKTELVNHPKHENGSIQCSDFADDMPNNAKPCFPSEEDFEGIPTKADYDKYEEIFARCPICDGLNLEEVKEIVN